MQTSALMTAVETRARRFAEVCDPVACAESSRLLM
jgi:hypothetical protein